MSNSTGRLVPAQRRYDVSDYFMLRANVLSTSEYERIVDNIISRIGSNFEIDSLDHRVKVALIIASPSLYERLANIKTLDLSSSEVRKLIRYLKRMTRRATPFGAFAGVALGTWAERTDITLSTEIHGRARMDAEWLDAYVKQLEELQFIRTSLRWRVASEATLRGGQVKIPVTKPSGSTSAGRAASITLSPMLAAVWELAQMPIAYATLRDALVEKSTSKNEQSVERFLDGLWRHRMLVTDLTPPVTCTTPLNWLLAKLANIPEALIVTHQLKTLMDLLDECAFLNATDCVQRIEMVRAYAANISRATSTKVDIQLDMALKLSGKSISRRVRADVARATQALLRLSPMPFGPGYLQAYKQQFGERYGINHEVPLKELLAGR